LGTEDAKSILSWLVGDGETAMFFSDLLRIGEQLKIGRRLNLLSSSITKDLRLDPGDEAALLTVAFYLRITNSHKAFLRESAFGYWAEAECIARPLFEALILMAESVRDPIFHKKYQKSQIPLLRRLAKKLQSSKNLQLQKFGSKPGVKNFDDLLKLENLMGSKDLDLRDLAKKNNLDHIYDLNYPLLHSAIHVKPDSIQKHFERGPDGNLIVSQLPNNKFPANSILQVNLAMHVATQKIAEKYSLINLARELLALGETLAKSQIHRS